MDDESDAIVHRPDEVGARPAVFISCDIIGHSKVSEPEIQLARVAGLNEIVRRAATGAGSDLVWASGGDGGHVILRHDAWKQDAIDLLSELRHWALSEHIPLRITAHYGFITEINGADGRIQPVGDGINMAGWILSRGSGAGIIVSHEFKNEIEEGGPTDVTFHDPRILQSKQPHQQQRLFLMSFPNLRSRWGEPIEPDRQLLREALGRSAHWEAIYYCKRMMQLNRSDEDVAYALRSLASKLEYESQADGGAKVNPFLNDLRWQALREVVQLGELIERGYNEIICRYDDSGDTMFVVLRGQIGVFRPEGREDDLARPRAVMRAGEIVGELAFALGRNRTADLVSLGETALLSFNYKDIVTRLSKSPSADRAKGNISSFITSRILEHAAHHASYLIGPENTGPLANSGTPWESILEDWNDTGYVRTIEVVNMGELDTELSLPVLHELAGTDFMPEGIYILVSGSLNSFSRHPTELHGEDFPLLYVDIPKAIVTPDHKFVVEGDAKVLHIGLGALSETPRLAYRQLIMALKQEARSCYFSDVFLAYNFGDTATVERWEKDLKHAGLRVTRSAPELLSKFDDNLARDILDSLTLLAFVSSHTTDKSPEENWVLKEVRFRRGHLDNESRILPVRLAGGKPEQIAPGYSSIDATANEAAAIRTVVQAIREIRNGTMDPPSGLRRHPDLTWETIGSIA